MRANQLSCFLDSLERRVLLAGTIDTANPYYFETDDVDDIVTYISGQSIHRTELADYVAMGNAFIDSRAAGNRFVADESSTLDQWWQLALTYRYLREGTLTSIAGARNAVDYANELVNQIGDFSTDFNDVAERVDWHVLGAASRVNAGVMTYYLMYELSAVAPWTGPIKTALNDIMGIHGAFIDAAPASVPNQRQAGIEALYVLGNTSTLHDYDAHAGDDYVRWRTAAGNKMQNEVLAFGTGPNGHFRPDGGHYEQSPAYGAAAITDLARVAYLEDARTGTKPLFGTGTTGRDNFETATDALYQMVDYRGMFVATGDTDRVYAMGSFILPEVFFGNGTWHHSNPDITVLLIAWRKHEASPLTYPGNDERPDETGRGDGTLNNSGFYQLRADPVGSQLTFDAGPYGSHATNAGHGQFDLFNIELSALGRSLIIDPGIATQASDKWTSRHNTIDLIDSSGQYVNHGVRVFSQTEYDFNDTDGESFFGADYSFLGSTAGSVVKAAHQGFDTTGSPAISPTVYRTVWSAGNGIYVVTDRVKDAEHQVDVGFNLPATTIPFNGGYYSNFNDGKGDVFVMPIPLSGMFADLAPNRKTTLDAPSDSMRRLHLTDSGDDLLFITLIYAFGKFDPNLAVSLEADSEGALDISYGGQSWISVPIDQYDDSQLQTSIARGAQTEAAAQTDPELRAIVHSPTEVELSWGDTRSGTVTGYVLKRDGVIIDELGPTERMYIDTGATPGSKAIYSVTSQSASGNRTADLAVFLPEEVGGVNGLYVLTNTSGASDVINLAQPVMTDDTLVVGLGGKDVRYQTAVDAVTTDTGLGQDSIFARVPETLDVLIASGNAEDNLTVIGSHLKLADVTELESLRIFSSARLTIEPEDSPDSVLRFSDLYLGDLAALDLNDNDFLYDYRDEVDPNLVSPFTQVWSWVLEGFGATTGIISSTSDGSAIHSLTDSVHLGSDGDWHGVSYTGHAILSKYTYFGDANWDGQVTGDDYTVIDSNIDTTPPLGFEWLSGDMNIDGQVTGDDYTVIDANFGLGVGDPL